MENNKPNLRIGFVGDISLGDHPKRVGFGFYSTYKDGIPDALLQRVLPEAEKFDIVIGNLEFPMTSNNKLFTYGSCCLSTPKYVSFLKSAGFTVLNVANNHAMDYGIDVFDETVGTLQNFNMKVAGIEADFNPVNFIQVKDVIVAFIGCSAHPEVTPSKETPYNAFEAKHFCDRIQQVSEKVDLVCVSIHWGEEFIPIESAREKKIGRMLIDSGADIVVGHHPHVLRDIEKYKNGIIAYSLGNFIGDMTWGRWTKDTGCLALTADATKVGDIRFYPAIILNDFFPSYLEGFEHQEFKNRHKIKHKRLESDLETKAYSVLAKEELRKHQVHTFLFLLRNFYRYNMKVLMKILSDALRARCKIFGK